ncbi:ArsR/SmtB family transcription factor [Bacillus cereus]|nr:helix-turn-helix domain-containing protein [Bacillus cereus]
MIYKGALNVSELCRLLGIPQSTVSQHLEKLGFGAKIPCPST